MISYFCKNGKTNIDNIFNTVCLLAITNENASVLKKNVNRCNVGC